MGVLGSVLSVPRFPSPPFHYLSQHSSISYLGGFLSTTLHFLHSLTITRFPTPTLHPIFCVHSFPFSQHFAMCNYTSSFIAGISFSLRLILSVTMYSFGDFSLIVFVVLLFCFCHFRANTIFIYAKCVLFSRVYSFSQLSKINFV